MQNIISRLSRYVDLNKFFVENFARIKTLIIIGGWCRLIASIVDSYWGSSDIVIGSFGC
ncbi:Uncharacterised protein [Mycobacteroides abscessus subsp. abscessus]|nr:Uncharacterised protein [Mycobacteroides abscessus subsp. abscessus]